MDTKTVDAEKMKKDAIEKERVAQEAAQKVTMEHKEKTDNHEQKSAT